MGNIRTGTEIVNPCIKKKAMESKLKDDIIEYKKQRNIFI